MTACLTGTSTRKVDDLVRALGCESGVSRSTVSRICTEIDEEVEAFRARRLDHIAMPYVYLDATYIKARHQHRIMSRGRRREAIDSRSLHAVDVLVVEVVKRRRLV